MNKPLVSVIVPIFNAEKTIEKCVDSIINQTYKNIEILLVNDGSTDKTEELCRHYEKIDSRVTVISKQNGGLISARITGVQEATADYIGFVDSDDWIEPQMFNLLVENITKYDCDLVTSGTIREFVDIDSSEVLLDNFEEGLFTNLNNNVYRSMLWDFDIDDHGIYCNLWNKLFKKDILNEVYKSIDTRVFYGEDALTLYSYLLRSKSIYVLRDSFYHYRIVKTSMSRRNDEGLLLNTLYLFQGLKVEFEKATDSRIILFKQLQRYILEVESHTIKKLYGINLDSYGEWEFDYPEIEGKKVIVYGAGVFGNALYKCIQKNHICEIVAWVDKNPEGKEFTCLQEILPISYIGQGEFDYILIGVEKKALADIITEELKGLYHIPEEKIKWRNAKHKSLFNE